MHLQIGPAGDTAVASYLAHVNKTRSQNGKRPNVIGRKRFGRITIANTDSAATADTDTAIDQAYCAVT